MTPNYLCFSTDLSSSEAAAWVQAIGSIVAILGSVGIAIYQLRKQRLDALALEDTRRRAAELDFARTLAELSKRSHQTAGFLRAALVDRETVARIARGEQHLDLGALRYFENAVSTVPLYALPHRFLIYPVLVADCLRQVREKIEMALQFHETMDASLFTDFWDSLEAMVESLKATRDELQGMVTSMELQNTQGVPVPKDPATPLRK